MDSEEFIQRFGRSTGDRIQYLLDNLSEKENKEYQQSHRLISFCNIWSASSGGSFDKSEHTDFFFKTNEYAIQQIDKVFFEKFEVHIELSPRQLGFDKDEWDS